MEFRRAMELDPGEVFGRHWQVHYLEAIGELAQAHTEMLKIVKLDPSSKMYATDLLLEYYYLRQPEKVVELATAWYGSRAMEPEVWTTLAGAYLQLGRRAEALETVQKGLAADDSNFGKAFGGAILARLGRRGEAEKILADLKLKSATYFVPEISFAILCFGLADQDQGFHYLEAALKERASEFIFVLPYDPQFDQLRTDPRYLQLLRRYRIPYGQPRS